MKINCTPVIQFMAFLERTFITKEALKALSEHGLTYHQFLFLELLAESKEGKTMTEVSKDRVFSTAAATGFADKLELKLGLVERKHAEGDRRKVFINLTVKGYETLREIRKTMEKGADEILKKKDLPFRDVFKVLLAMPAAA